jgi:hypothetical protein
MKMKFSQKVLNKFETWFEKSGAFELIDKVYVPQTDWDNSCDVSDSCRAHDDESVVRHRDFNSN